MLKSVPRPSKIPAYCGYCDRDVTTTTILNPKNFDFHQICKKCRSDLGVHFVEPFCCHGVQLGHFLEVGPCGCTLKKHRGKLRSRWVERGSYPPRAKH
jgi:hypothetical protein